MYIYVLIFFIIITTIIETFKCKKGYKYCNRTRDRKCTKLRYCNGTRNRTCTRTRYCTGNRRNCNENKCFTKTYRYACGTQRYNCGSENYRYRCGTESYTCGRQTYRYPCGSMNYVCGKKNVVV